MPKKSAKKITKKPIVKKEKIQEQKVEKEATKEAVVETKKTPQLRENTKISKLIELIKSSDGVTLTEIAEALKWQKHTARSVLSRLNKNHNLGIISDKSAGNNRLYKMAKKD